jgi:ribonuclease P protein component
VLRGASAFDSLFRHGRRIDGRYLQCVVAATAAQGRVGWVISRKHVPRAVDRNRLRRQIREMLRTARVKFVHYDLIVRVKRPLVAADLPAAAAEARALLDSLPAQPAADPS